MAAFTPCTTGTVALYVMDDDSVTAIPVEAWTENGAACIAGLDGLVPAISKPGFLRLEQVSMTLPHPDSVPKQPVRVGPKPRPPGPRDPTDPRGPREGQPRGRQP